MTIVQLAPLPLRHLRRGKVREVYEVDGDRLLLVATDRVSAFDVVMAEPIPYKGAVLTQMTWSRARASSACAAAGPFSPVADMRAAISPETSGVANDVPLHRAMPSK